MLYAFVCSQTSINERCLVDEPVSSGTLSVDDMTPTDVLYK